MYSSHAATVSIKTSSLLWDWKYNKGKLLRSTVKLFICFLWTTIRALSTLESQLNTAGQENPMFAELQLQWPLTLY